MLDIIELLDFILSSNLETTDFETHDINQDLNIDIFDVVLLISLVLNGV